MSASATATSPLATLALMQRLARDLAGGGQLQAAQEAFAAGVVDAAAQHPHLPVSRMTAELTPEALHLPPSAVSEIEGRSLPRLARHLLHAERLGLGRDLDDSAVLTAQRLVLSDIAIAASATLVASLLATAGSDLSIDAVMRARLTAVMDAERDRSKAADRILESEADDDMAPATLTRASGPREGGPGYGDRSGKG